MKDFLLKHKWPLLLFFLLFVSLYHIFIPHTEATAFSIVPDSIEYSLGAENLMREGHFGIYLDGTYQPSRYTPWFSASFLLPFIWMGQDARFSIYGIFLSAVLLLIVLLLICRKLCAADAVPAALILLFLNPYFREYSSYVMTEIPYTMLLCVMMSVYMKIAETPVHRRRNLLFFALLTAWCGMIRSSAYPMLLLPIAFMMPLLKGFRHKISFAVLFCLPSVLSIAATMLYNKSVFGSCFRNGYQYWCPIPYDYPDQVFSIRFIPGNLLLLIQKPFYLSAFIAGLLVCALLFFQRKSGKNMSHDAAPGFKPICYFAALQSCILFLLYMPYFFPSPERFLFPATVLWIPAAVCCTAYFRSGYFRRFIPLFALAGAVFLLLIPNQKHVWSIREQYQNLKRADRELPQNAVLMSGYYCPLIDRYVLRETRRRQIPFSRSQEYADKILAPVKPQILHPDSLVQLLQDPHCKVAVPFTAEDDLEELRRRIREQAVFMILQEAESVFPLLQQAMPDLRAVRHTDSMIRLCFLPQDH